MNQRPYSTFLLLSCSATLVLMNSSLSIASAVIFSREMSTGRTEQASPHLHMFLVRQATSLPPMTTSTLQSSSDVIIKSEAAETISDSETSFTTSKFATSHPPASSQSFSSHSAVVESDNTFAPPETHAQASESGRVSRRSGSGLETDTAPESGSETAPSAKNPESSDRRTGLSNTKAEEPQEEEIGHRPDGIQTDPISQSQDSNGEESGDRFSQAVSSNGNQTALDGDENTPIVYSNKPSSKKKDSSPRHNDPQLPTGMIVGISLGGLFGLIAALIVIFAAARRRSSASASDDCIATWEDYVTEDDMKRKRSGKTSLWEGSGPITWRSDDLYL